MERKSSVQKNICISIFVDKSRATKYQYVMVCKNLYETAFNKNVCSYNSNNNFLALTQIQVFFLLPTFP